MSRKDVKFIYDSLFSFENKRKEGQSYPIHKPLKFKEDYEDINEWLHDHIMIANDAKVLDAGCGTGYTLLELCKNSQRSGIGISLSDKEIASANQSASNLKLSDRCLFKVHDFAEPLNEKFDLIIAMESLKHSPDIKKTCSNLSAHLKPNGRLILVEDYYIPNKVKGSFGKTFMEKWSVQDLHTEAFFVDYFKELNCKNIFTHDFTDLVHKKNAFKTKVKVHWMGLLAKFMPKGDKKSLAEIYQGGLIMDYFYKMGAFEYKLIVFQKGL